MLLNSFASLALIGLAAANLFDFLHNQNQQQPQRESLEQQIFASGCANYLCPDTLECEASPQKCPCLFPSSQLRCVLPNGEYLCISKPAGAFDGKYDDPKLNWKVDAKDDNVRDCGWITRTYKKGL